MVVASQAIRFVFQKNLLLKMSSMKMLTWVVLAWFVVVCMRQCNFADAQTEEQNVINAMLNAPMHYASAVDPDIGRLFGGRAVGNGNFTAIDPARAQFKWKILHPTVATSVPEGGFVSQVRIASKDDQRLFHDRSHEVLNAAVRLYKEQEQQKQKQKQQGQERALYFYVWHRRSPAFFLESWMWVIAMEGSASSCEGLVQDGKSREVGAANSEGWMGHLPGGARVLPWQEFARGVHTREVSSGQSETTLGRVSVMAVPPLKTQIFTQPMPSPGMVMVTETVFDNKEWVRREAIDLARHLQEWDG